MNRFFARIIFPGTTASGFLLWAFFFLLSFVTSAQSWHLVGNAGFNDSDIQWPSIAVSQSGTIYVAYQDYGHRQGASAMKFDGAAWDTVGIQGFSAGMALTPSIALDSVGTPYVGYVDNGNEGKATVMKYSGGIWTPVGTVGFTVDSAESTQLVFDPFGTLYMIYSDDELTHGITVMKFDGASWITVGAHAFAASSLQTFSLAFDATGTPYVAFDGAFAKAQVMKFDGSSWVTVGTAGFSVGESYSISIAVDTGSTPYVAYTDAAYGMMPVVMKWWGGSWVTVGLPAFSSGAVGFTTLAIDEKGTPYVSFEDATYGLKATVMKFNGTAWVTAGAAGFSDTVAYQVNMTLDKCGTPYVVFADVFQSQKATVMMLAPDSVNGQADLCLGDTVQYYDNSCYGSWSSSNPAVVSIDSTSGVATAVAVGTASISYLVDGVSSLVPVHVHPYPAVLPIAGVADVCPDSVLALTDAISGGAWSSGNTAVCTIGSSGAMMGVAAGTALVSYKVTNGYCSSVADTVVLVDACPEWVGLQQAQQNPTLLIYPNPAVGSAVIVIRENHEEVINIAIADATGRVALTTTTEANLPKNLQLNLPAGVYVVTACVSNSVLHGVLTIRPGQ